MPTITELRKQKAALLDDAKALKRAAEMKGRDLDDQEFAALEKALAEAKALDGDIQAAERRAGVLADFEQEHQRLSQVADARAGVKAGPVGGTTPGASVRPRWEDDPNKGFKGAADFFGSVLKASQNPGGRIPENLEYLRVKAAAGGDEQSTFSDPYGGFLVPEGMSPNLLQVAAEADPVAGRTTQVPMDAPKVEINARVDKDHSTSVSGGLRVYRRAESAEVTASRMQMEQIELKASSLMGVSYSSEELLADSPRSVAALLAAGYGDEFRSRLSKERIRGTGVGEFLGILNSPALVTVSKEAGQAADTINGTNLIKMRARCWGYSNAIWLANHDALPQLATAHLAGTNASVFLFAPAQSEDVGDMLIGRPIFFVEDCSTLGDLGDIILFNPTQYLEGTYQPLQSAESIHVRFVANERAFRFTLRNAGAPWWRSALTPKNSTNTLSPMVTLEAR